MRHDKLITALLFILSTILWLLFATDTIFESEDKLINAYLWGICLTALLTGLLSKLKPEIIAISLVLPALILAIWTFPRGDGDGLWVLIFPILLFFGALSYGLAVLGNIIRKRTRY